MDSFTFPGIGVQCRDQGFGVLGSQIFCRPAERAFPRAIDDLDPALLGHVDH